jgi:hypothetical protein
MRNVKFHQPGHPEQPLHGIRYYGLCAALILAAGLAYLLWAELA